ncbi:hypothetical protein Tco_0305039 [Tanacetum coccineum]
MVVPSYCAPLSGGEPTWETRSPKSQHRESSGCPPFGSFIMSLEESGDLNIPEAEPVDLVLEASSLPKFDMHLYKSSLTKTNVKWYSGGPSSAGGSGGHDCGRLTQRCHWALCSLL